MVQVDALGSALETPGNRLRIAIGRRLAVAQLGRREAGAAAQDAASRIVQRARSARAHHTAAGDATIGPDGERDANRALLVVALRVRRIVVAADQTLKAALHALRLRDDGGWRRSRRSRRG